MVLFRRGTSLMEGGAGGGGECGFCFLGLLILLKGHSPFAIGSTLSEVEALTLSAGASYLMEEWGYFLPQGILI